MPGPARPTQPDPAVRDAVPDRDAVRARFPALAGGTVYFENAGGSQVPRVVAEAIARYMQESYVQLDAPYDVSHRSTETVARAHAFAELLANGTGRGRAILGASCSALLRMLADCYAEVLRPGDEIVVAETGHEANVGPWMRLGDRPGLGIRVRIWRVDPASFGCGLDALDALLSERTRLVTFPHVSNLLGEVVDVAAIADRVHRWGARVVVDGVAYAPHRAIDVAAWNVDYYAWSAYKVYGPHMAVLWGRHDALAELTGPNHFFIARDEVPYKFELGGASHEACAGLLALGEYLGFLAGHERREELDRAGVAAAFGAMERLERPLQERLVDYLNGHPDLRVLGPAHGGPLRVPTVSFVSRSRSSAEIARAACDRQIGIRSGHMYAYRLCRALGLDPEDGVVRASLLHYNTPGEVERLIEVLEALG